MINFTAMRASFLQQSSLSKKLLHYLSLAAGFIDEYQPSPSAPERDAALGWLLGRAQQTISSSLQKISSSSYPARFAEKKTGRAQCHAQV
ncbi:hypothetical protein [Variovorax sp. PCZ-1]|uniref:hypothetical protein n=1 Tax=Variovorax sp. PCZ-1 TaxID=2835533 RepID=UPI001BD0897D|nr:hypothetical protein [Variovorax sp. PCZ-1]MBS7808906.1 hypothetical protein [Variovorax sp. PCZ-1]